MKRLTAALLVAGVASVGAAAAKPADTLPNSTRDTHNSSVWTTMLSEAQIDRIVLISGLGPTSEVATPSTQLDLKRN
ncbi:MAG: hypothetical protein HKP40_00610 [Litoreibacter sp.]|nr:hypothetical protein [Litoreibacter sp.]